MMPITPVVKQLLIINILMFIVSMWLQSNALALYYPGSEEFRPYQIVTHFFMHANLAHLFFNMFALYMFGSALEARWGEQRFLFFYFFCAIGAAALHTGYQLYHFSQLDTAVATFQSSPTSAHFNAFFDNISRARFSAEGKDWLYTVTTELDLKQPSASEVQDITSTMQSFVNTEKNIPAVGASGAVYGLLLAFGMLFPNVSLMLIFLPIPIKAKYFIPVLMSIELFLGVQRFSWDNIAHFAHLGGALFGLILILFWRKYDHTWRIK